MSHWRNFHEQQFRHIRYLTSEAQPLMLWQSQNIMCCAAIATYTCNCKIWYLAVCLESARAKYWWDLKLAVRYGIVYMRVRNIGNFNLAVVGTNPQTAKFNFLPSFPAIQYVMTENPKIYALYTVRFTTNIIFYMHHLSLLSVRMTKIHILQYSQVGLHVWHMPSPPLWGTGTNHHPILHHTAVVIKLSVCMIC